MYDTNINIINNINTTMLIRTRYDNGIKSKHSILMLNIIHLLIYFQMIYFYRQKIFIRTKSVIVHITIKSSTHYELTLNHSLQVQ